MSKFQGDVKIFLLGNDAEMTFQNGQPVMDDTVESEMMIRLFTRNGWIGNMYAREDKDMFGSDFIDLHDRPVTSSLITDIRDSADKALSIMLDTGKLAELDVFSSNPDGTSIYTVIASKDSRGVEHNFKISRTGNRWIFQKIVSQKNG